MKKWLPWIIGFVIGVFVGAAVYAQRDMFRENFDKDVVECVDGKKTDKHGCCPGEVYTDLYEQGFACCTDNECYEPLK